MKKQIGRVVIEKHPRVDPHTGRNYVCLVGSDGDFFYNDAGNIRRWKRPAYAKRFLQGVCARYPNLGYIVTNLSGKTTLIGITEEEIQTQEHPDEYEPHAWRKVNIVTLMEEDGGSFDIWRCIHCGQEQRRYGLSGRPAGGSCPARKIQEVK